MRICLYLTRADQKPEHESTTLLVPESHLGDPPPHPDGGSWSYLATVETEGDGAVKLTQTALRALELQGFYMRRMEPDA